LRFCGRLSVGLESGENIFLRRRERPQGEIEMNKKLLLIMGLLLIAATVFAQG
jgi:hypothetical protein